MDNEMNLHHAPVDYATDPHLSKAVKKILKPLNGGGPGLETLATERARQVLVATQNAFPVDLSGIDETDRVISHGGFEVKINILKPIGQTGIQPVFLFIHGGGWILGDYPTHKRMVRDLVVLTGYTGVFVNYTPSPEARYPRAIHEIFAVAQWLSEKGAEISIDPARMGIVGNSVGGNMTAATTLMARENGGPDFKIQIMMWPVTDAKFDNASWKAYGQQRFLTDPLMRWMWDQYTTDPSERGEIFASPLRATLEQLKGLPPALIQVAENDILRDEGEAYGRKLEEAGVDVTTVRYNGVIHDFGLLNGLAGIPQTKALFLQAAATLQKYLK
jgi:acetyl esterase